MRTRDGVVQGVRRQYIIIGLNRGATESQILSAARNPDDNNGSADNVVPPDDQVVEEIGLPRFTVARSRAYPTRATISVEWGVVSFASGPAIDTFGFSIGNDRTRLIQPYITKFSGEINGTSQTILDAIVKQRVVSRPVSTVVLRTLLPSSLTRSAVISNYLENLNKRYDEGVLTGMSVNPVNATQYRVFTEFSNFAPVKGQADDEIEPGSRKVAALGLNEFYGTPDTNAAAEGTPKRSIEAEYEQGGPLQWLS